MKNLTMPININTDISNILNVAQHYGGPIDPATRAIVALLTRALHDSLRDIIRDFNRELTKLEEMIHEQARAN